MTPTKIKITEKGPVPLFFWRSQSSAATPALSTRVTTLSPALCDVVHALLEKDPADRPANTAALLDRLNPI